MRKKLPPPAEESLRELAGHIAEISDPATVQALLEELLTPAERLDLALRWCLLRRLQEGVSQRRIARELGVSLCKITRGSGVLKDPKSVCRHLLASGLPDRP